LSTGEYYDQILDIATDYLGPAAGRFVNRQIVTHLNKAPEQLQKSDIPMLAIRIRSGLVVLTKDEDTVKEAFQRISSVGNMP
jgi:predicted nuclease of predicted toxin-antitoxin system